MTKRNEREQREGREEEEWGKNGRRARGSGTLEKTTVYHGIAGNSPNDSRFELLLRGEVLRWWTLLRISASADFSDGWTCHYFTTISLCFSFQKRCKQRNTATGGWSSIPAPPPNSISCTVGRLSSQTRPPRPPPRLGLCFVDSVSDGAFKGAVLSAPVQCIPVAAHAFSKQTNQTLESA